MASARTRLQARQFPDLKSLQELLHEFALLTGITVVIMDTNANRITRQTLPHNRLCMDLIKGASLGRQGCNECDLEWGRRAAQERTCQIYTCRHGLIDFVSPIMSEGEVLGYLFGGQVLVAADSLALPPRVPLGQDLGPDSGDLNALDAAVARGEVVAVPREWHEQHARMLGIDRDKYLGALDEISVLRREKIEASARVLHSIANSIGTSALLRQQAQTMSAISDDVRAARESKRVAGEILDDLPKVCEYRSASLQLIRGELRTLVAGRGFDTDAATRNLLRPVSLDPLIGRVVRSREPLILSNVSEEPDWESQPATADVSSWVGLPVVHDREVIGLLTLDHDQPGFYTAALANSLVSFASQVAPRIEYMRLWDSAQRLIRDMEIVNEVANIVNAKLDTDDLLACIAGQIAGRLDCSHCTIFLPQTEDGELLLAPKVTRGNRQQTMSRRFKPGEGLAGWVFREGKSVLLPNASDDERFAEAREKREQDRSMLVAPIKAGDQTIGIISADQDAYGWFTETDLRLVEALAQHAGIAVQRAEGLKLLQDIGTRILGLPKVDDILHEVVTGAIRLTSATTGVIYLLSDDGRSVLAGFYPQGFDNPSPRMDREDGLTRTVFRTGRVIRLPDIAQDPRVNPVLCEKFRSMIVIPMKIGTKVIGVLFLDDEHTHNFTDTEESLLLTLAGQAAIAIQNARLFDNLQREVESHKLLENVLENLVVREPDQDKTLDRIGEGIRQLLGPEVSPTINLYDQEADSFGACHAYGPLRDELSVPPREKGGTARHVLETREPLYLSDVRHPPPGSPTIREESIALGIKSFAAIPLKRQDRVVGVLFVNAQKGLTFTEAIRGVLQIFASHAGVAIEIANFHRNAELNAALLKAAGIGCLASGIAHEFYGSIHRMLGLVEEIEALPEQPGRRQHTRKLRGEMAEATATIDVFRSLRHLREGVQRFDLDRLVTDLLTLSKQWAKDHGVVLDSPQSSVRDVRMNAILVHVVIVNLIR
ncbi:MAG: GAF domain-containing protein, partial [Acidobacteria bacterium]|nr:GAF domain-containing protein [Acidobacteriota bacterium]